jgi:ribosomal protein S18 acetylase RimI-like enzyme
MPETVIRRAGVDDVDRIADAHRESIETLGPAYYPPTDVAAWKAGLSGSLYLQAMVSGEVFFVALGEIDGQPLVLGFSSDYAIDGTTHGTSVYVRGRAARRGIGTALLRHAEAHARATGATAIQIESSLAGVAFYGTHGYREVGRGHVHLKSGHPIACVSMRKDLA